ncbi:hypothetical protein PC117_g9756 [Phytophthora cactorum]|uniref:Uncharacterized protein n=1 Tax=Phytophthora cactorum TaxID=29920 RepID=A0A8T1DSC6_9STRA|nr:hypothetical protein PC117_g9756 [Phytophthora cactorum]
MNDFLFDETAKLVVHEELYLMPSTASRFLSKEILLQMEARENHQYMVVERTQTVDLPTGVVLVQLVTVS